MKKAAIALLLLAAASPARAQEPALKDVFKDAFLVGAALNPNHFFERDTRGVDVIRRHFNTISPENELKWERVHPRPGVYDFAAADRYVAFGEQHRMFIVGHTLGWHSQTPAWVFTDAAGAPVSRDTLLLRLKDHIQTVVGRYRGRIHGWDVFNEILNEDGTLRKSKWLEIIGEDYVEHAFRWAQEADPSAELYYNDYSLENAPKRAGAVALIRRLQSKGLKVTAVGLQGHHKMDWPSVAQQDSTIEAFAALGIKVAITELDVDILPRPDQYRGADVAYNVQLQKELNPFAAGLPDSMQQALARRYEDVFRVLLKHRETISRVTFWGVTDADSWLNGWPVRGRTNYPLLFDREGRPKPAFYGVLSAAGPKT